MAQAASCLSHVVAGAPEGCRFAAAGPNNVRQRHAKLWVDNLLARTLTGDARPRFFETLCSGSRCGAREALTVGYQPTSPHAQYSRISRNFRITRNSRRASPVNARAEIYRSSKPTVNASRAPHLLLSS